MGWCTNQRIEVVGCPDPFKDKVKCHECKHWIDKSDAHKVEVNSYYAVTEYYCPMHKKPYTRKISCMYPVSYYGEVGMDEDGTPIGYTKKK